MSDADGALVSQRFNFSSVLARLFSFEGRQAKLIGSGRDYLRIHRAATLWLAGAALILGMLLYPLAGSWAVLVASVPAGGIVWLNMALVSRRSHDVGWSATWPLILTSLATCLVAIATALAFRGMTAFSIVAAMIAAGVFIPLAAVVLMHPGTAGPNRFGPDPRETK